MIKYIIALSVLMLSACSVNPSAQFVYGGFYMVGDSQCKSVKPYNESSIRCYDSSGEFTSYRYKMTDQQLSMYENQRLVNEMYKSRVSNIILGSGSNGMFN